MRKPQLRLHIQAQCESKRSFEGLASRGERQEELVIRKAQFSQARRPTSKWNALQEQRRAVLAFRDEPGKRRLQATGPMTRHVALHL